MTACVLPLTPNFWIVLDMWLRTVFSLIPRNSAISDVDLFATSKSKTSCSLFVSIFSFIFATPIVFYEENAHLLHFTKTYSHIDLFIERCLNSLYYLICKFIRMLVGIDDYFDIRIVYLNKVIIVVIFFNSIL